MSKIKDNVNILAIDPATKMGFATSTGFHGMRDFKTKKDESNGIKLLQFKKFLIDTISTENINLVAFERPAGRFKNDIISHAKWVAIIESVCTEKKVEYVAYSPSEIKLHATGKGNANKALMIKHAILKYKFPVKDDNEADALHILDLAKTNYYV